MKTFKRYTLVLLLALLPTCGQQLVGIGDSYAGNPGGGDNLAPKVISTVPANLRTAVADGRPPDRDVDGVPDQLDRCPDVAGPHKNLGCPPYDRIIVHRDKLELKEHIQFAWNKHTIERVSCPLLDEVVKALKDNKSFTVRIQGHASSDGPDERNQTLSKNRAKAVLNYLVAHGVAKNRLQYQGFSSSVPLKSNVTRRGRVANRRVVFKVDLIILKK